MTAACIRWICVSVSDSKLSESYLSWTGRPVSCCRVGAFSKVAMISARGAAAAAAASNSWKAAVDRALGCRNRVSKDEEKSKSVEPIETSTGGSVEERNIVMQGKNSGRAVVLLQEGEAMDPATAAAAMDPEIWRNLPFHLLECVLAWLPIPSLLRLRCVCKRINNLLYSQSLWTTCRHRERSVGAWYLFRGEGRECVAFNPEADSWCKLPLGFLPSSKGRVVAATGGLLCVRQGDRMIVCNPLSHAWLELPQKKNTWKFPIVGMVMDADMYEYKVIVAGRNSACGKNLVTEVYSSQTKKWKDVNHHPVQHHYQTSAVYCNGFLYSAGFDGILAYNMEQEQWTDMKGPAMQDTQLMLPQICECNGCLLMVEVESEHFLMTRVSIWALRQLDRQWLKLTSMPQKILDDVISISGTRLFTYFGHGDLICFTIARRRVLVYSMSRRMWRWLPRCPFVQGFARRFTTLAYEPRVEGLV